MTDNAPTARPFADSVIAYAQAGWPCIMPVPLEKSPPPVGFTGADGRDTDPVQLVQWATSHGDWSVALRMPDGVIGIDIDQYEKGGVQKHGLDSFAAAVERWGPLPFTWSSTARGHVKAGPGASRIMFFRAPPNRYVTKLAGGDVEIIQRHHRYAVVWPSPHKDAGDIYRWYDPAGHVSDQPPKLIELPELPQSWVDGLREGATDAGPAAADRTSGGWLLQQLIADERPACAEITSAALTAVGELGNADAGSRHDTATGRMHQLVQLAAAGHPGLGRALPGLAELWDRLTAGEERTDEWERMLLTSARKAVSVVGVHQVANDPCTVVGDIPIAQPIIERGGPAPGSDVPGMDAPEPIQAPEELHPHEIIGAVPFTPREHLDQLLADAVLERMYPVLRYGYDTRSWIKRQRTNWELGAELAEWAITQVAETMPRGNVEAEKGTEERDQADRRKRLMTAGGASGVAKMMRARVAGGSHPCALRVADLDSEPWLLWAGGVAWDLTASRDQLTAAQIDPATPHMRAAGCAPERKATPLWDAFTAAVWPDVELRRWALRVLAVAFTGYSDKALPILIGEKDRGKTQVVALLMSVLGSYAHAADPRLLNGLDNAHASIIYALKGRRLSFIDEGPREGRLGQERLKQLTGGGDLTGNQMNRNPITFTPTHTLVLTANDEPLLTDPAVRGRTRLIPCEGDSTAVRAARAAIGHTSGKAWRREAPGVLAAMISEAAAWLADPDTALTSAAPEAYRNRAEEIAAEQDPVRSWVEDETEPHAEGERSRALYEAFVGWSRNGNAHPNRIVSETKWGRELNDLGYAAIKRSDGNYRPLRLRPRGAWIGGGSLPISGGMVESEGFASEPSKPQENPTVIENPVEGLESVEGNSQPPHMRAHVARGRATRTRGEVEADPPPSNPPQSHSAKITARLLEGRTPATTPGLPAGVATCGPGPITEADAAAVADFARELAQKPRRTKIDPAVRAAEKAAAKAEALMAAIAEAAGELVQLPAVVTRDGAVRSLPLDGVGELAAGFGWFAELTVDVETSGYPIGHPDYALRTIQLGNEHAAVVLDANDAEHVRVAGNILRSAAVLHAHSATADLVPLAIAQALDLELAWDRMHDTVIPAKLADPSSTGSDPGLKKLSPAMLRDQATVPAADEARAALFKAGKWLTDTKATTPVDRSGWAQVDSRCTTMVRYAASDVLDTAALARVLPIVPPAVLERERTAQRMTAKVALDGLRLDGEHIAQLVPMHATARDELAQRITGQFGISNPGSDQQVGQALILLGARLPQTKTGRPSVAKGVLDPFRNAAGQVGELVTAVLDYRHHDTVLTTFLEPYQILVNRGDGRARPTIYTLGADTGRMSCVRPNLQQMPRQGNVRACVTADPGELLVSADFAGVELRVAAALSGDPTLRALLDNGIDVHGEISRQAFGPDATKADRYNTKRGVFGWLYGASIATIARTLGISESTAAAIVDSLKAMAPDLAAWSRSISDAVKNGHTQFPSYSGRTIHLPARAPHAGPNYCIQGTARELLIDTLMRWHETRWGTARLLPVHDELLVAVPEAEAAEATATLTAAMECELYGVRIKAEASAPAFAWQDAA